MNSFVRVFLIGLVVIALGSTGYFYYQFKKIDGKYREQISNIVDGYAKVEPKIKSDIEKFVFPDYLKQDPNKKNANEYLKKFLKPGGSLQDIPMSKFNKPPFGDDAWQVDFKWMKGLSEFGYWEFASETFKERLELVPPTPFAIQILNYAKLRYGLLKQDYKKAGGDAAVLELRSLQRLLYSTQVPILTMILNSMMNAEVDLAKYLTDKKIKFKFQPVSQEQNLLLRALIRNSGQLFSPFLSKEILTSHLSNPKLEPLKCAGLTHNLGMILAAKSGFLSRFPEQTTLLIDAAQKSKCSLNGLQEYFNSPAIQEKFQAKYTHYELSKKSAGFFSVRFLSFLPIAASEPFVFRMTVLVMNRGPAFAMF